MSSGHASEIWDYFDKHADMSSWNYVDMHLDMHQISENMLTSMWTMDISSWILGHVFIKIMWTCDIWTCIRNQRICWQACGYVIMDSWTSHHKTYVDMCHLDMHQKSEIMLTSMWTCHHGIMWTCIWTCPRHQRICWQACGQWTCHHGFMDMSS